jgi:hypothetical protein
MISPRKGGSVLIGKNKKGQWLQLFIAIPVLFIFMLVVVFMNKVGAEFSSEIQNSSDFTNQSKSVLQTNVNAQPSIFDGIGALVIIGLWLAAMVAAYAVDSHPLWGVMAIFLIAGLGVASMILANAWEEMSDDGQLSGYAEDYPVMNFFFSNYLILTLVMSFSTLWVLLYRGSGGGYG